MSPKMDKLYNTMKSAQAFTYIFYEILFKSLKTHSFMSIKCVTKI